MSLWILRLQGFELLTAANNHTDIAYSVRYFLCIHRFYASITNLMSDRHRISFVICFLLTSLLSDSVVLECLDQWTIARTILPRYIHNNRIDHLWRYLYTFIRITHFSRRHRWCTGIDTLYQIYADRDTPTAYTWHGISRVRGQGGKKRENK